MTKGASGNDGVRAVSPSTHLYMVDNEAPEEIRKIAASKFKQQDLPSYRPRSSPNCVMGTLVVVGALFVGFGIAVVSTAASAVMTDAVRYDNKQECTDALKLSPCYTEQHDADGKPKADKGIAMDPMCARRGGPVAGTTCDVEIDLKEGMEPPIYVYYQISNLFQNHRRYVQSRLDQQLRGEDSGAQFDSMAKYKDALESKCRDAFDNCRNGSEPVLDGSGAQVSLGGEPMFYCNPCGLVARSFFTDTFVLKDPSGSIVHWTQDNTNWDSDVKEKYLNSTDGNAWNIRLPEEDALVTDPDFIGWMRTAALPEFRKLYRIINTPLEAGKYTMTVTNNYDVSRFEGNKAILLAEMTGMGIPAKELGWCYIIAGGVALFTAIVIMLKEQSLKKKNT
eukprot:COSAG05_NODE_1558_length_4564_cov_5.087794_6_plen_393_part_00